MQAKSLILRPRTVSLRVGPSRVRFVAHRCGTLGDDVPPPSWRRGEARAQAGPSASFGARRWSSVLRRNPHTGDVTGDPRFVNYAAGDYRIKGDSPAIDAGARPFGLAPSDDINGSRRPQGKWIDLGAHEYGTATPKTSR
jgi:hypothetical protein